MTFASRTPSAAVALIAIAASAVPVWADDFAPPSWRGNQLSVRAEWEFPAPPQNWYSIPPEAFDAVPGPPQYPLWTGFTSEAEADDAANWNWTIGDGDGGITPAPGVGAASIAFKVQNWIDDLDQKLIRLQITWQGVVPPSVGLVTGYEFQGPGLPYLEYPGHSLGQNSTNPNHLYQDWIIVPNPDWELLSLNLVSGTVLDEVVIDTISIPTAGSFGLLTLAGLLSIKRRR